MTNEDVIYDYLKCGHRIIQETKKLGGKTKFTIDSSVIHPFLAKTLLEKGKCFQMVKRDLPEGGQRIEWKLSSL